MVAKRDLSDVMFERRYSFQICYDGPQSDCDVENASSACHAVRIKKLASRVLKTLLKFKVGFQRDKPEVETLVEDKSVINKSFITVAMDMLHLAMGSTVCCL